MVELGGAKPRARSNMVGKGGNSTAYFGTTVARGFAAMCPVKVGNAAFSGESAVFGRL